MNIEGSISINQIIFVIEFLNVLGVPGNEDSYDDEDQEIIGH